MEATEQAIDDALQGQINELETEIDDRLNEQDQGNLRGTMVGQNTRRPTFDLESYDVRQMKKRGTMVGQATRRPTFDLPSYEDRQTNLNQAALSLKFLAPERTTVTELQNYVRENQLTAKQIEGMSSNELSNIRKDLLTKM